jgi:hypothetical protein
MHVVLPDSEIALLCQSMCNGAGIIAAERLKLLRRQSDDDFVLDGDDLEQVHPGLLRPCALYREGEKRDCGALDEIAARKHAVVLWFLGRRIDQCIGHGARDLRGCFATALSFAPQKRFTAGNKCGPMNSDAKRRVQVQELDGAGLDESKRHSLSLGSEGRSVAADPWPEIDIYFVDDTTADAGLNNYVHTLKKHWSHPPMSIHI